MRRLAAELACFFRVARLGEVIFAWYYMRGGRLEQANFCREDFFLDTPKEERSKGLLLYLSPAFCLFEFK